MLASVAPGCHCKSCGKGNLFCLECSQLVVKSVESINSCRRISAQALQSIVNILAASMILRERVNVDGLTCAIEQSCRTLLYQNVIIIKLNSSSCSTDATSLHHCCKISLQCFLLWNSAFGRPFVKRFALCYWSFVCSVCLSCL